MRDDTPWTSEGVAASLRWGAFWGSLAGAFYTLIAGAVVLLKLGFSPLPGDTSWLLFLGSYLVGGLLGGLIAGLLRRFATSRLRMMMIGPLTVFPAMVMLMQMPMAAGPMSGWVARVWVASALASMFIGGFGGSKAWGLAKFDPLAGASADQATRRAKSYRFKDTEPPPQRVDNGRLPRGKRTHSKSSGRHN